jgi:FkbM family methyltransferase|tara:strand:+ start:513 stop:1217 length:705 start_codon:yes stop_codon:yes gene_type:complete
MLKKIYNKISIYKRKIKSEKKSYSFGGVDLIVNYFFKNKKKGFYLDVGSQHPIENNNTYLLYKKGWNGLNIDLDKKNIELFNVARKKDLNVQAAIASKFEKRDFFFYHQGSPINTIVKDNADIQKATVNEIRKINTVTLNSVLENHNINTIDYLNIDVEGGELEVMKGFNLQKYNPKLISVEFLDLKMKSFEFKNNSIENIFNSAIYKHMINNNYFFVNWSHGDLIFVNNESRD